MADEDKELKDSRIILAITEVHGGKSRSEMVEHVKKQPWSIGKDVKDHNHSKCPNQISGVQVGCTLISLQSIFSNCWQSLKQ